MPASPQPLGTHGTVPGIQASAWLAWVSLSFVCAYWASNHLTSLRSGIGGGVFGWERGIPFVAWTIVPYLSILLFFSWSFFVRRERDELVRHASCLLLALLLSIVCYAVCPLRFMFERPAVDGFLGLLFDALGSFDLPYNRAPSLHISVLVILWKRLAPALRDPARLALQAWFTLIGVSVLTTYQHHVIDVAAGLLMGALCIVLTAKRRATSAGTGARSCGSPQAARHGP